MILAPVVRAASATSLAESGAAADTRKADRHGRAFAGGAADGDRSCMFFNDFLHRRETEACTCPLRRKEGFEDLVDDFFRDRDPVVFDENLVLETSAGSMLGHLNVEVSPRAHGFDGVLEDA